LFGQDSKPIIAVVLGKGGLKSGLWLEKLAVFCKIFIIQINAQGMAVFRTEFPGQEITEIDGFIGDYRSLARCPASFAEAVKIDPQGTVITDKWDDFLCRIFIRAEWRDYLRGKEERLLQKFQKKHKYLLMAFNPGIKNEMGRLAAAEEIYYDRYGELLKRITRFPAKRGNQVNSIQHIFGYFSSEIREEEKKVFLNRLNDFGEGQVEISEIRRGLKELCNKYPHSYIQAQSFLEPFPPKLLLIKPEQSSRK